MSLQRDGCVYRGTVQHEIMHAAGWTHMQSSVARDDFIEILWNNIPNDWRAQYEKNDPRIYELTGPYDYYSVMHYGIKAPGTNKDAFRVKKAGIDVNRIGAVKLSNYDIAAINKAYC